MCVYCREYFIRAVWCIDVSVDVMWKFFFDNQLENEMSQKEDLKDYWVVTIQRDKELGRTKFSWQEKTIEEKEAEEWDISVVHWAISKCGDFFVGREQTEKDNILEKLYDLKKPRNELFHRRRTQISREDYERMMCELSNLFDRLLGDEARKFKDTLEEITQSESTCMVS